MASNKMLIVGNGFDLEHELPTSYIDFLSFTFHYSRLLSSKGKCLSERYDFELPKRLELTKKIKDLLDEVIDRRCNHKIADPGPHDFDINVIDNYINELLVNNSWYEYFLYIVNNYYTDRGLEGNTWVDFESEIQKAITDVDLFFDAHEHPCQETHRYQVVSKTMDFFAERQGISKNEALNNKEEFIDKLYSELQEFIVGFDFYLREIIEKIKVPSNKLIKKIEDIHFDYVLSFNYTSTFEKYYNHDNTLICHVHGQCRCPQFNGVDQNIVLGMGNEVDESGIPLHSDFSMFRKNAQRMANNTDTVYSQWIRQPRGRYLSDVNIVNKTLICEKDDIEIWIYGHSLDPIDGDILKPFMNSESTKIHLFVRNQSDENSFSNKLSDPRIIDYSVYMDKISTYPRNIDFVHIHD